jgi:hypothetical protein
MLEAEPAGEGHQVFASALNIGRNSRYIQTGSRDFTQDTQIVGNETLPAPSRDFAAR